MTFGIEDLWKVCNEMCETRVVTLREDLSRNEDQAGRLAVRLFRGGRGAPRLAKPLYTLALRVLCGVDLPLSVQAGPGLRLPHGARGTIIHPDSKIGSNATIYHGVTLGVDGRGGVEAPTLGDCVYIGAGAVFLGGVHIGAGAKVGANAVVMIDVPEGRTAVGMPARIVGGS